MFKDFARRSFVTFTFIAATSIAVGFAPARAEVTAFKQAVAEAAARDADIANFYKSNGYASLWTGNSATERKRRAALMQALDKAASHGLPAQKYDAEGLMAQMRSARTDRDRGILEVELSKRFLQLARDMQTGILVPSRVDPAMVRQVPYRDRMSYLVNFSKSTPTGFFRSLHPQTTEYTALMKEKMRLQRLAAQGGWGPTVSAKSLKPGQSGAAVVALRNRLIAMGFMKRSNSQSYDTALTAAVQEFQVAHGLTADGVAGAGTIKEVNRSVDQRMQSILVAMERERWLNRDLGKRHIRVNIPDFTAKVIDNGKVSFETRSVVGATKTDRVTPEFSDVMEFMVINPSWYVPRSIATKEYLPALKKNPYAVQHLEITDSKGRKVNRGAVDFSAYTASSFPFAMRQPPSKSNALGLVKFMFPNRYNIYLHDTPAKNLFGREVRAYSHGCVRLAQPFEFAYEMLSKQEADPKGFFHSVLKTNTETRVDLKKPVPVHLIYRTAFTTPRGHTQYRRDIYGRDAKIWDALQNAGVALRSVQG